MSGIPYRGVYVPWGCRKNTDSTRQFRYKVAGTAATINSGYTFLARIHTSEDDLTVLETYAVTFPSSTVGLLTLTDAETGALTAGSYYWTFEVTTGSTTTPLCYGPYEVADWP